MKKNSRIQQDDKPGGLTHNPFAALRGTEKPAPTADERNPRPDPKSAPAPRKTAKPSRVQSPGSRPSEGRLLVQREKKGRAGKVMTRVSGLTRGMADPAELMRDLKRALGCGATLDGQDILLQGALTDRVATWLRERLGVDVTIGN